MNYISVGGNQKVVCPQYHPVIAVKISREMQEAPLFDLKITDIPRKIHV
jgi:hypothetical protein